MEKAIEQSIPPLRKPHICCVKLFERCIMRCKMCSFWQNKTYPPNVYIPLQQWEKFLVSLKKFLDGDPIEISLSGGEPLMHKDIFALIKMIDGIGFTSFINSNGYLLINKSMAGKIAESNLKKICLSLDSFSSDTHDYLRGRKGSFKKVMDAIKYLRDASNNLEIGIITIIMGKNVDDILPLSDWVQKNNDINSISFQVVMQPFGEKTDERWYDKEKYKELWPQSINKVYSILDSLIKLEEAGFSKITNTISQLEAYKKYFKEPENFIKKDRVCNLLDSRLFIDPLGKVYLCAYKGEIGHIDQDVERLYFSDKAQEARKQIVSCKRNCHEVVNCNYED